MDFDAAAEALAGVNSDPVAPVTPAPEQAPVQSQDSSTTVEAGTNPVTQTAESFTDIDLTSLPPEVQALAKNLQADYTRKTQEIAPLRKLGVDAEAAAQAVEFVSRLNDPEFAQSVYAKLGEQFGTPDYASEFEDTGFEDTGDPRDQQINQLENRLATFEQNMLRSEVTAQLDRQEALIRQQNPGWDDSDIEQAQIYALAHQGDLLKGAEVYKGQLQRVLGRHLQAKGSVPVTGHIPITGNAEVAPQELKTDRDIHQAAMRMYLAEQGS
jgi:hypothetical protein